MPPPVPRGEIPAARSVARTPVDRPVDHV